MKRFIIAFLAVLPISLILGFIILFEGNLDNALEWWTEWTRDSESLPGSPYNERRVDSGEMHFEKANEIEFVDKHLFWKGSSAIAIPELGKNDVLTKITILSGGSGYSEQVVAKVTGAMANEFELGPVVVDKGQIVSVSVINASKWNLVPLAFHKEEKFPFSGTTEKKFPSGQIITESPFLSGVLHGQVKKYSDQGIPVFKKDYVKGLKHGTHIFFYPKPVDPENYKPAAENGSESLPTLWLKLRKEAKDKFGREYGSQKANKWVVEQYTLPRHGGDFQVRLLEHWKNNLKHGLFEGYDKNFYQTFESEYVDGRRIKHKTFDKNK
jgi:hypothetical protein